MPTEWSTFNAGRLMRSFVLQHRQNSTLLRRPFGQKNNWGEKSFGVSSYVTHHPRPKALVLRDPSAKLFLPFDGGKRKWAAS